jgi:hypothetical protein
MTKILIVLETGNEYMYNIFSPHNGEGGYDNLFVM